MIERGGFLWPDDDKDAHVAILRDYMPAVQTVLNWVVGRDLIFQAGGNVGVYPKALSEHFCKVVTCEPDRQNIACLWKNLAGVENVDSRIAALGEDTGTCRVIEVHKGNCGAHRVEPGGDIVMLAIDDFDLPACDCIWLDIEGYELNALKGAKRIIESYHPIIVVEEKGLCTVYNQRPEDLGNWLSQFGYTRLARVGRDNVYG